MVTVGKHNSLLIIGTADSNNYRNDITYAERYKDVYNNYGDSPLTSAYETAYNAGAPHIFLMNCRQQYDILNIGNTLRETDFTYIVPISVMLSDEFDEPNTERRISYLEYLMEQIGAKNDSVFIATDKHASLYEDIDTFINDMNNISSIFKHKIRYPVVPENIIFLANNLYNYDYPNVLLGAVLCNTELSKYPSYDFGEAYFNLDSYENIDNWAYFQNHQLRSTTVENLINYQEQGNPLKIHYISRIIKAIKRELDFDIFIGKRYTEYQRLSVEQYLDKYLQSILGSMIYDYNIVSVRPYRSLEPMCIDIENVFEVWPLNCLEKVTLSKTVSVM